MDVPEKSYAQFLATYVDTNVSPDVKRWDGQLFSELIDGFIKANPIKLSKMARHILAAMFCGIKRPDLVPRLFKDAVDGKPTPIMLEQYNKMREALVIIWPFVGVPQVIPACLGLAGFLQCNGVEQVKRSRIDTIGPEDVTLGLNTRKTIYAASSNSEVFDMLRGFHGDIAHTLDAVAFGYNMGRVDPAIFTLQEAEFILTAGLIALKATRQAGSHIKACIGFGYSEADIQALVDMSDKLSAWQGQENLDSRGPINVGQLARQARENSRTHDATGVK